MLWKVDKGTLFSDHDAWLVFPRSSPFPSDHGAGLDGLPFPMVLDECNRPLASAGGRARCWLRAGARPWRRRSPRVRRSIRNHTPNTATAARSAVRRPAAVVLEREWFVGSGGIAPSLGPVGCGPVPELGPVRRPGGFRGTGRACPSAVRCCRRTRWPYRLTRQASRWRRRLVSSFHPRIPHASIGPRKGAHDRLNCGLHRTIGGASVRAPAYRRVSCHASKIIKISTNDIDRRPASAVRP